MPNSTYNHNMLTTLRISVKESLQMHFEAAVIEIFMLLTQAGDSLTNSLSVVKLQSIGTANMDGLL